MKKITILIAVTLFVTAPSQRLFAWGKSGHNIVAEVAYHFLDDSIKNIVNDYLGMSIQEAANWMDDSKGNSFYDYMRSWHYLDIDKGEEYKPTSERNILNVLHSAISELKQYKTLKKKDVKRDLLLIFHLIGDLHQPLHCGYAVDKGGNAIDITSPFVSGNLHHIWDTEILETNKINMDSCIALYNTMDPATVNEISRIDELKWMYDSRSLLDTVYSFNNNFLDKNYVDSNGQLVKKQLLKGGLRLAAILKKIFT